MKVHDASKTLGDMTPEVQEMYARVMQVVNDRKYSDNDVLNVLMNLICRTALSVQVPIDELRAALDTTMIEQSKPECGHPQCEAEYVRKFQEGKMMGGGDV